MLGTLSSRTALLNQPAGPISHSKRATLGFIFLLSFTCSFMFLLGLNSDHAIELVGSRFRFFSRPEIPFLGSSDSGTSNAVYQQKDSPTGNTRWTTLGVASDLYVISLKRRKDRRTDMEKLRRGMGLRWTYVDALEKSNEKVDNILAHMQRVRANTALRGQDGQSLNWGILDFDGAHEGSVLETARRSEVYLWPDSPLPAFIESPSSIQSQSLVCATQDSTIPTYSNISEVPSHMRLSRGMVACWYSHVSLLRRLVESQAQRADNMSSMRLSRHWNNRKYAFAPSSPTSDDRNGTAIIFEDDIDMEWDLHARLERMWPDLPSDWDIVFLGHCWSPTPLPPLTPTSPLHPSLAPKCTHAYALSRKGVPRLLAHLSHPRFAYSRALDQAISWLVESGRLRAFSIVPSVVVQRKLGLSDIWEGEVVEGEVKGSAWRETLVDSAFERAEKMGLSTA